MNWLKKLFAPTFEAVKADALREIDRAIGKLQDGSAASTVVRDLRNVLTHAIGAAHLPGIASVLVDLLLSQVDWVGMAGKPSSEVIAELQRIRLKVDGARL